MQTVTLYEREEPREQFSSPSSRALLSDQASRVKYSFFRICTLVRVAEH